MFQKRKSCNRSCLQLEINLALPLSLLLFDLRNNLNLLLSFPCFAVCAHYTLLSLECDTTVVTKTFNTANELNLKVDSFSCLIELDCFAHSWSKVAVHPHLDLFWSSLVSGWSRWKSSNESKDTFKNNMTVRYCVIMTP